MMSKIPHSNFEDSETRIRHDGNAFKKIDLMIMGDANMFGNNGVCRRCSRSSLNPYIRYPSYFTEQKYTMTCCYYVHVYLDEYVKCTWQYSPKEKKEDLIECYHLVKRELVSKYILK